MAKEAQVLNTLDRLERQLSEFEDTTNFLRTGQVTVRSWPAIRVRGIDRSAQNSFIFGHPTNGFLGTSYNGLGGGQIVIGDDGLSVETVEQLHWRENKFKDYLTTDAFLLSGSSFVNTGTHRIDIDSGNTVVWQVSKDTASSFNSAKVDFDLSSSRTNFNFTTTDRSGEAFTMTFPIELGEAGSGVTLEVSNDGGVSWVSADNKENITFDAAGSDLQMRITAQENGLYWKTNNTNEQHKPVLVTFS